MENDSQANQNNVKKQTCSDRRCATFWRACYADNLRSDPATSAYRRYAQTTCDADDIGSGHDPSVNRRYADGIRNILGSEPETCVVSEIRHR